MEHSPGYVRGLIRESGDRFWQRSLATVASKMLAEETDATEGEDVPPLLDYIPAISPEYVSPLHLKPITDAFERIAHGEQIELAYSVPPRHTKTETLLHGVMWLFRQVPGFRVAYLTYNDDFAEDRSRLAMRIARKAGFGQGDRWTVGEWSTDTGCTFKAASLLSGVTGLGFDLVIVDDPYRRRQDAESPAIRKRVSDSFRADVYTRQDTKPTSFIVLHTRWHVADLIGEITDDEFREGEPFDYINLPAISPEGEALWPQFYYLERLDGIRKTVGEYEWASQYQGNPKPRGSAVFEAPTTCAMAEVPTTGRPSIGVDLAYSKKTSADSSVALTLIQAGTRPADGATLYYVADIQRKQVKAPDFGITLRALCTRWPGAPMTWHAAGTEKGSADFLIDSGIPIKVVNPNGDKFIRAQPAAAAWNNGQIIVPRDAPWSKPFLDELAGFTGLGDIHDDQVDALASAFSAIDSAPSLEVHTSGRRTGRSFRKSF